MKCCKTCLGYNNGFCTRRPESIYNYINQGYLRSAVTLALSRDEFKHIFNSDDAVKTALIEAMADAIETFAGIYADKFYTNYDNKDVVIDEPNKHCCQFYISANDIIDTLNHSMK